MSNEWKIGDEVVLKTLQPPVMVIESLSGDTAKCIWFDKQRNKKSDDFHLGTLTKYEQPLPSI